MPRLQKMIKMIHEDRVLMVLALLAKRERVQVYLVGGAIRDLILSRRRGDYDFVLHQGDMVFVRKLSRELKGHLFSMGKDEKGRVYRILAGNDILDFNGMDGSTIGEDLSRRDFTINAIAYSLPEQRFYCHPGSEEDIEKKLIRMVSPEGFDRDPLRMIRGIRYLSVLADFQLDEKTRGAIRRKARLVRDIPVERIKMEVDKILLSPKPFLAMRECAALGLFREIFPEIQIPGRLRRTALFRTNAFSHYLRFLKGLAQWNGWEGDTPLQMEERLILSYIALFITMGKILAKPDHWAREEPISNVAYATMTRMKFSNRFKELVKKLMDNHGDLLKLSQSRVGQKALRQFIYRVDTPVKLLITFSLLEQRANANGGLSRKGQNLAQLCHRMKDLCKEGDIISLPALITGRDVITLGYEPGPVVGYILHCVREKQVRGEIGNRQQALAYLRETFGKGHFPQAPPT